MAISKDEIEKYIFDPENPKQCKSYGALLSIAKRDDIKSFISPDFLKYFVSDNILNTHDFEDAIWDKPSNYDELNIFEKLNLYVELNSIDDLNDYLKEQNVDLDYLRNKYSIFDYIFDFEPRFMKLTRVDDYIPRMLVENDTSVNAQISSINNLSNPYKDSNLVFLSKNIFSILKMSFSKVAVMITCEEEIDTFLKYKNSKVKPIFLKKIEDLDLLLNILEKDLRKNRYKNLPKEEISNINQITIENFFSIKNISIDMLKDKKEIYIVGENGDGKTLLLQAITIGLAGVEEGDIFNLVKSQDKAKIEIVDNSKIKHTKNESIYEYIFAYGASRYNSCQMKEDETGYLTLFENRYDLRSPVEWLQYLDYNEKSAKTNIVSVEEAKGLLNMLLNKEVEIEITPDDVLFKERGSVVSFEQLSAGYKGVVTIICDLIARLYEKQPYVVDIKDFRGVVLIDEVELHLHPKWKYNFMKKLRDTFPLIQFIVTTHSPTVILGASKEAVFYKIYKDDGKVSISNQIANEGYTNNSLVSSPLFDMETITSREYEKTISSDDYIYDKIHQQVAKKIEENMDVDEAELLKYIDEELDKI